MKTTDAALYRDIILCLYCFKY